RWMPMRRPLLRTAPLSDPQNCHRCSQEQSRLHRFNPVFFKHCTNGMRRSSVSSQADSTERTVPLTGIPVVVSTRSSSLVHDAISDLRRHETSDNEHTN